MAKKDLIGGSLWEQYSNKVSERMLRPRYIGEITPEEATRRAGSSWGWITAPRSAATPFA